MNPAQPYRNESYALGTFFVLTSSALASYSIYCHRVKAREGIVLTPDRALVRFGEMRGAHTSKVAFEIALLWLTLGAWIAKVMLYLSSPQERAKLPFRTCHFLPSDMSIVKGRALGLRHLSSSEAQTAEANAGMTSGCSLNLCNGKPYTRHVSEWAFLLPGSDETQSAEHYERGIDAFLQDCIRMDLDHPITPHEDRTSLIVQTVAKTRFSLLDYSDDNDKPLPVDFYRWEGRGRFPKSSLAARYITPLPCLTPAQLALNENALLRTNEQVDAIFSTLMDHYRAGILAHLRSLDERIPR